jgi:hypothetical protein
MIVVVRAAYDEDARVWYVQHSDLDGLHIEAETLDAMRAKLPGAIRDLLEDEGPITRDIQIEIIATTSARIAA